MANYKKCFRKIKKLMDEDRGIELLVDHFDYKTEHKEDRVSVTSAYSEGITLWVGGVPFSVDFAKLSRTDGPLCRQKLTQAMAEWHAQEDHGNILNWI